MGDVEIFVVFGVVVGEGCLFDGGCVFCLYMKMNSYDALMKMCDKIGFVVGEVVFVA